MRFESLVIALCDRFVSQRAFDLIVTPALADFEFEQAGGRSNLTASRAAVLRAVAGGVADDMRRGSGGFLQLALLSACYYLFPIAVSVRYFKTWSDFFVAASFMLVLSLTPVVVCFWPVRHPVRHGD
jgi:hypothetical protein